MRQYQLALVLSPSLTDLNKKKFFDNLKITLKGAKISKEEDLGEKELSYSIRRETKGLYTNLLFDTEVLPSDLERKLNSDDKVLRHLLLFQK